ncbi:hypothetical protein D9611_001554 [Ephemerocybe angulata]|uniref:Angiogenic factor with G patch and FHA domains 1 n=1 Tax=Ephemerocybe angulata TaxID=980116 RepID=A0A8H5CHX7_9AGAR|nr:hypothetical protein D9611_001554 [Tulosesus angulatus]
MWDSPAQYTCEPPPNEYDPSFEWPGPVDEQGEMEDDDFQSVTGTTSTSFLRLVVVQSSILSKKHRLAILTGYPEIQLGRDKPTSDSVTPRIRLREMEVSKIHATAYWDGAKKEWALVDMGSMHGTFLTQAESPGSLEPSASAVRLSRPRVASLPHPLHHMDLVAIGSTTFQVHIHTDDLACSVCASTGNEISLFHSSGKATPKVTEPMGMGDNFLHSKANPKKSLAMLKSSLLQQHSYPSGTASPSTYTDRADRRRRMYGSLPPVGAQQQQIPRVRPVEPPPRPVVSDPPQRLSSSNVGHGLLTKMGWEPGTALGLSSSDNDTNHLLEPIQPKHTTNRAGLGVASTSR